MRLPNYNVIEEGGESSVYSRAFGRKMIARLAQSRVKNDKLTVALTDGTQIVATRAHDQYRLTITTLVSSRRLALVESALWLPRGFVVYPSSSTSTSGWGAPVIRAGAPDPLNADSLAPGLDVTRWTPGGPLGEVLLTKQVGAGYPTLRLEITPAFFSGEESPTLQSVDGGITFTASGIPYSAPAEQGAWAAYRVEFTDFNAAGGEGDPGARQAVFNWAVDGAAYLPPIRGYYDAAARLARYVVSEDFFGLRLDDGALSKAATGYATAAQRLNKDGVADAAHDSISKATNAIVAAGDAATGAHLYDSTFTPARTSVSVALKNGMTALAAVERSQWIAYGNRYWIGDDPALPILTWDGWPSWNWPIWMILGTQVSGDFVDLSYFTVPVRGANKPLFSKRVYANGRVIGTLPDWVLSAGVQTSTADDAVVDRIVVFAWRLADQGTYDPVYALPPYGDGGEYARVLRVYYLDVPRRNGVALLPDAAAVGLYNTVTNPDGWHYAGQLVLWPLTGTGADTTSFHGLAQPPQFNGDGSWAVFLQATFNRGSQTLQSIAPWEIEFSGLGDGLLSCTLSFAGGARDQGITWTGLNGHAPGGRYSYGAVCLGVDYAPGTLDIRVISSFIGGVDKDGDGLHYSDNAIRWSGADHSAVHPFYLQPNDQWYPLAFETHDGFAGYAAYALDPVRGAFAVVQQLDGGPSDPYTFRVYYGIDGKAVTMLEYDDPAHMSNGNPFAGLYLGNSSPLVTSFARDKDGDYVAGYELAPNGTFEGSFFDSSIGDVATLTQTPGVSLRLFPIGVV